MAQQRRTLPTGQQIMEPTPPTGASPILPPQPELGQLSTDKRFAGIPRLPMEMIQPDYAEMIMALTQAQKRKGLLKQMK